MRCNKLSVVGNRNSTTEKTNRKLKNSISLKCLKRMLEKLEHDFSEACSERTRGNVTGCSTGNFSSISGEFFTMRMVKK